MTDDDFKLTPRQHMMLVNAGKEQARVESAFMSEAQAHDLGMAYMACVYNEWKSGSNIPVIQQGGERGA